MALEILLEPNPRPQIYPIDLFKKEININFLIKQNIAINLISLHEEAKISLELDKNICYILLKYFFIIKIIFF